MIKKEISMLELHYQVLKFLKDHKEDYTEEEKEMILKNYAWGKKEKALVPDILRQIYDELDLLSPTKNIYLGFLKLIEKNFSIDGNLVELGGGRIPSLAKKIALQQKNGTITVYDDKLINFQFRHKPGWRRYQVILEFTSGKQDITYKDTSPYIRGFLKGNFLRPSCYDCDYTSLKRYSDLTIGDFWNYFADNSTDIDDDKGISFMLINNENGKALFDLAKDDLFYLAKDFNRSTSTSPRLHKPTKKPATYEQFWQDYNNKDFENIIKEYF